MGGILEPVLRVSWQKVGNLLKLDGAGPWGVSLSSTQSSSPLCLSLSSITNQLCEFLKVNLLICKIKINVQCIAWFSRIIGDNEHKSLLQTLKCYKMLKFKMYIACIIITSL